MSVFSIVLVVICMNTFLILCYVDTVICLKMVNLVSVFMGEMSMCSGYQAFYLITDTLILYKYLRALYYSEDLINK